MIPTPRNAGLVLTALLAIAWGGSPVYAQDTAVRIHMAVQSQAAAKTEKSANPAPDASEIVVWLNPLDAGTKSEAADASIHKKVQLVQHNKTFQPHVLVVPVGSVVQFPNRDPFFHNVFSLFDGKRFDLGLYEAGSVRNVSFDRAGISYIFCNIHAEMSAVVIALDTPYFGISNRKGEIVIPNVP